MPERFLICMLAVLLGGCISPVIPPTRATPPPDTAPTGTEPAAPVSAAPSATVIPETATPAPSATPGPEGLETLELEVTGCPGGVALDWSPTTDPEFHHYTALRSLEPDVATDYPPIAPAVDWGDSYATDRFVTSAVDATLIPSEAIFHYRVMAYDAEGRPIAASQVRRARPAEPVDLGAVDLGAVVLDAGAKGGTRIDWGLFGGLGRCFSEYRVLVGPAGSRPSTTLTVLSDQSTTELETVGLHAGASYAVRVDAVRTTTLGSFVVARSETATYSVP